MQRSKKRIVIAAASAVVAQALLSSLRAHGATITWDGGGADDNLNDAVNWVGDANPATTDDVVFTGLTRLTPIVNTNLQYKSITFNSAAGAFSFSGSNTLVTGATPTTAGNISNNSNANITFGGPIGIFAGNISANNGPFVFNGLVNLGNGLNASSSNNITVTGGFNTTFAGGITGAGTQASTGGQLTKSGGGTLYVTNDSSTWAGRVSINGGVLQISNANALGTGGGTITVVGTSGSTGNGTLELTNNITLTKTVTLGARQAPTQNQIHIRNVSGNNTINNLFTSTGGIQYNFESLAGNLTIASWNSTGSASARTLRMIGAGNGEFQGWTAAAGNVVTVIKEGAGTWSLRSGMSNANGVFGPVTVNGGTLVFDNGLGSRETGNVTVNLGGTIQVVRDPTNPGGDVNAVEVGNGTPATTVNVKAGGALDASTFTIYSLQAGQTLIGGGTLSTGGKLSASGDNAIYIGDVSTAAAGTLMVNGNLAISNAFAAGAGGLHFDLTNDTTPGGGINDQISVSGDFQLDNTSGAINLYINPLSPQGFANGTYNLISYNGASLPSPSDFHLIVGAGGQTRQMLSVATQTNQVNLNVSGSPANLVWKGGNAGNAWDIVTTQNWVNGVTGDKFYQLDNVTFDDSSANTSVVLTATGAITPGSMTISANQNYNFSGSPALSIGSGLTKNGGGTATIANSADNTYGGGITVNAGSLIIANGSGNNVNSGAVAINGGTLQFGIGGSEGSVGSPASIADNGVMVVNRSANDTINAIISGTGSLAKQGTGTLTLTNSSTYTGATTIDAGGTLQLGNGGANGWIGTGTITDNGTLTVNRSNNVTYAGVIPGSGNLIKTGAGVLQLTGTNTYTGSTTVTGGWLRADDGVGLPAASNLTLNGGILQTSASTFTRTLGTGAGQIQIPGLASGFTAVGSDLTITINNGGNPLSFGDATFNPATLVLNDNTATANIIFTSNMDLPNNTSREIKVDGMMATVTGVISGVGGQIRMNGAGTLVLAGANTYTNGTVIDDGNPGAATVRVTNSSGLGNGGIVFLGSLGDTTTARLELANNINVGNPISLFGRNNNSVAIENISGNNTLSGKISLGAGGDRNFVQSDSGFLTLSGSDPAAGGIAVTAVSNNANGNGRIITLKGSSNGAVTGTIEDGGSTLGLQVIKDGAGTWTLSGNNTYTGNTTVTLGALIGNSPAAYPSYTTPGKMIVSAGGTLAASAGGAGQWDEPNIATLFAGASLANGSAVGINVDTSNTFTYNTNITPANTVGFTKLGPGTLILGGNNTYTGSTTVSAGTLSVASPANLGDPANGVTLGNGGTLLLTGSFLNSSNHKITMASGGGTIDTGGNDADFGAIDPGDFTKTGAGKLNVTNINANNLTVSNGTLHVRPSGLSPISTSTLAAAPVIAPSGRLDVEDNAVIITYPTGDTTHSVRDTVRNLLRNGRNAPPANAAPWNGAGGITSTYAHNAGNGFNLAIGYADNTDLAAVRASGSYTTFGGQTVASNTVLVQLTRGADATMDGIVDGQDVAIIGTHFQKPGSGQWCFGDFDYSGTCDGSDVAVLGTTFGKTSPVLSPAQMTAEFGSAFTRAFEAGENKSNAVPEPGSLTLIGLAGLGLAGRKKRRTRARR